jgi:hypothetical protein
MADGPQSIARTAALLCAVALLWLATRPYFGTVFDARFYMLEALNNLHPARFAQDLYVRFGSQGSFSIFTKLYRPLLLAFGVGTTGIVLTVAGQLLWLLGLFRLARTLVGGRTLWLSVAVVIGMLQIYAGGFGYGEGYVTAAVRGSFCHAGTGAVAVASLLGAGDIGAVRGFSSPDGVAGHRDRPCLSGTGATDLVGRDGCRGGAGGGAGADGPGAFLQPLPHHRSAMVRRDQGSGMALPAHRLAGGIFRADICRGGMGCCGAVPG